MYSGGGRCVPDQPRRVWSQITAKRASPAKKQVRTIYDHSGNKCWRWFLYVFSLACMACCKHLCQEVNSDKCASLLTLFLGRCISHSLQCNGEPDCDDFSDEDGCENVNQRNDKCSTLIPIPGAERGTQGWIMCCDECTCTCSLHHLWKVVQYVTSLAVSGISVATAIFYIVYCYALKRAYCCDPGESHLSVLFGLLVA